MYNRTLNSFKTWPNQGIFPACLEGLIRPTKRFGYCIHCPDRDSNRGPVEYNSKRLITKSACSEEEIKERPYLGSADRTFSNLLLYTISSSQSFIHHKFASFCRLFTPASLLFFVLGVVFCSFPKQGRLIIWPITQIITTSLQATPVPNTR